MMGVTAEQLYKLTESPLFLNARDFKESIR